jgi:AmiR/NasT family two-component response regulator
MSEYKILAVKDGGQPYGIVVDYEFSSLDNYRDASLRPNAFYGDFDVVLVDKWCGDWTINDSSFLQVLDAKKALEKTLIMHGDENRVEIAFNAGRNGVSGIIKAPITNGSLKAKLEELARSE